MLDAIVALRLNRLRYLRRLILSDERQLLRAVCVCVCYVRGVLSPKLDDLPRQSTDVVPWLQLIRSSS